MDINETLRRMETLLRRIIREDIELRIETAPGPLTVMADSSQIEQVVLNLTINARDAMPNGGKLIIETAATHLDEAYASCHADVQPGDYIALKVTDTGSGMTPEVKARLFEPYFSTKPDGTGLGLAIVSAIVADHNGFIRVRDNLPRGSRFVLEFPVRRRAAQ